MKKTDKKIDNSVRLALTEVCETALEQVEGFQWLTHFVNFSNFPAPLRIVCVFDTQVQLAAAKYSKKDQYLLQLIIQELAAVGINVAKVAGLVSFDTEEACEEENAGMWNARFRSRTVH